VTMISGWFAPLFFLIPLISWSRLRLKAHTMGQVVAGTIVGFVIPYAIALLVFVG
jgi:membrane-associated phospholipid phosphatase